MGKGYALTVANGDHVSATTFCVDRFPAFSYVR